MEGLQPWELHLVYLQLRLASYKRIWSQTPRVCDEALGVRIVERSEALTDLHSAHRVQSSAFVTGSYPMGRKA